MTVSVKVGSSLILTPINGWMLPRASTRSGRRRDGKIRIVLNPKPAANLTLHLRIPSWAERFVVRINRQPYPIQSYSLTKFKETPASGYDPRQAWFLPVRRFWSPGDVLELEFEMQVKLRCASPRIHSHKNKVALSRGPLVYCLENVDNPGVDIFTARLDPSSLHTDFSPTLLEGTQMIAGKSTDGKDLVFIPYFLWANRGESQMSVWVSKGCSSRRQALSGEKRLDN